MNQFIPLDEIHEKEYRLLLSRLIQARLDAGMTQMEVAQKLGKPQSFVSRSETGARRIDAIELNYFAKLYGKSIADFIASINAAK